MLILSRKIGETIHVGEDIVIKINRVAGNRVTVGIDAPKSVRVLRGEVCSGDGDGKTDSTACEVVEVSMSRLDRAHRVAQ